jgi:hypothetical protein
MNEVLTIDEINRRYPDEFVLIGDPVTDESLQVLSGTVLYHGKDHHEMYRMAQALPAPKRMATHYTGELTECYSINIGLPRRLGLSAREWYDSFESQQDSEESSAVRNRGNSPMSSLQTNEAVRTMTIDEINAKYDSEWVLIGDPETDEQLKVHSGQVLFHSDDRDELYRKAAELRPARSAIVFTGSIPEDMEFLLGGDCIITGDR